MCHVLSCPERRRPQLASASRQGSHTAHQTIKPSEPCLNYQLNYHVAGSTYVHVLYVLLTAGGYEPHATTLHTAEWPPSPLLLWAQRPCQHDTALARPGRRPCEALCEALCCIVLLGRLPLHDRPWRRHVWPVGRATSSKQGPISCLTVGIRYLGILLLLHPG